MTPLQPPPDLRFIGPFLQRSSELKTREPIVSYYCLLYATTLALEKQSVDAKQFVTVLIEELEKEKIVLTNHEEISNQIVGFAHVENFALRIFSNSDNEDRNGLASKKTAKSFFAAASFLEVLKVFGEPTEDILQKIKYAKWKAADIIKATNEGRIPVPGPPGGLETSSPLHSGAVQTAISKEAPDSEPYNPYVPAGQLQVASQFERPQIPLYNVAQQQSPYNPYEPQNSSVPQVQFDAVESVWTPVNQLLPPQPAHTPSHQQQPFLQPPAFYPSAVVQPSSSSAPPVDPFTVDHQSILHAQKAARHAISCLQYEDIENAVVNLQKSISLLTPFLKNKS